MMRQTGLHEFIRTLLFTAIVFMTPVCAPAGEQADQAIAAVKKLVASGKIAKNTAVKLVAKQGNIDNFWGVNYELKNEWERQTGVLIDAAVMPQLPLLEYMRANKNFDFALSRQDEYPDLFMEGHIADLTAFVKKYGLRLEDNPVNGFFRPKSQTEFDEKVVAIPADGDIAVLYIRKDMMADPKNQARFKERYHRELKPPSTWDEYQDLIEFFHMPERGFFGTCEQRDPQTGWMFWMPRYASQAAPNQFLFDENMRPLINTKAGVAATAGYVKTISYSPPHILKKGNHYNYTVPIYRRGDAFAHIITIALAKMLNQESSPVKDKFMCVLMPGTAVEGKLVRRTSFIYGNNIVISRSSKNKELAFLFALWFSDPDISARSIRVATGIADPFRFNHLRDAQLRSIYTGQALDVLEQHLEITVPGGTGLPGESEYIAALNKHLGEAAKGELTAQEAMDKTAVAWERITDAHGRDKQIRYWRSFRKKFPETISSMPGK